MAVLISAGTRPHPTVTRWMEVSRLTEEQIPNRPDENSDWVVVKGPRHLLLTGDLDIRDFVIFGPTYVRSDQEASVRLRCRNVYVLGKGSLDLQNVTLVYRNIIQMSMEQFTQALQHVAIPPLTLLWNDIVRFEISGPTRFSSRIDDALNEGVTSLMRAVRLGDVAEVQLLMAAKANLEASSQTGDTALSLAVRFEEVVSVDLLLRCKADVTARSLDYALGHRSDYIGWGNLVGELLSAGNPVLGVDALADAAIKNQQTVVDCLLRYKADINAALLKVVQQGNVEATGLLLSKGGEVNSTDAEGRTLLVQAISQQNRPLVDCLLEKGASVHQAGKDGKTPFMVACENYIGCVMQKLFDKNPDKFAKDSNRRSVLMYAALVPNCRILSEILKDEGVVNEVDAFGKSALNYAVMENNLMGAECLITAKADVNHRDGENKTPLIHAITNSYADMVKLLLERGANLEPGGIPPSTSLEHAQQTLARLTSETPSTEEGQSRRKLAIEAQNEIMRMLSEAGSSVRIWVRSNPTSDNEAKR